MRLFGDFVPFTKPQEFEFDIIDSPSKAKKAYRQLKEAECLVIDIETTSLDPLDADSRITSVGIGSDYICVLPIHIDGLDPLQIKVNRLVVKALLESSQPKIGHNLKFDTQWLFIKEGIDTKAILYDTLLGAYLLDEHKQPRGLKYLTRQLTTIDPIEVDFSSDEKISFHELMKYNASDIFCNREIFDYIFSEIQKQGLIKLWRMLSSISINFGKIELEGFEVDLEKISEFEAADRVKEAKLKAGLVKYAEKRGFPNLNPGSPAQLARFLFDTLRLQPVEYTEKGSPSTNEKTLKQLNHPFTKTLLLWRKYTKRISTYYTNIREHVKDDGRVHPDFKLWGTVTGRTSCSQPNLQNIPRKGRIRDIFRAKEGCQLIEADLSQHEIRVACMYSTDPNLTKALESGRDPHREIASFLFRKEYSKISAEERQRAKTLNFAILYGMSPASLAEELTTTVGDARNLINIYFERFSSLAKWMQETKKRASRHKEIKTIFGRRRRFPELYNKAITEKELLDIYRQAVNFPIQSTASDLSILGMNKVSEALIHQGLSARIVCFVHDSVIVEAPDEEIDEVIKLLKKEMVYFNDQFPVEFAVGIKAGKSWGSMEELSDE